MKIFFQRERLEQNMVAETERTVQKRKKRKEHVSKINERVVRFIT